jgi:hypothetical protein
VFLQSFYGNIGLLFKNKPYPKEFFIENYSAISCRAIIAVERSATANNYIP